MMKDTSTDIMQHFEDLVMVSHQNNIFSNVELFLQMHTVAQNWKSDMKLKLVQVSSV